MTFLSSKLFLISLGKDQFESAGLFKFISDFVELKGARMTDFVSAFLSIEFCIVSNSSHRKGSVSLFLLNLS